jgi:5-methylthioribose kinase
LNVFVINPGTNTFGVRTRRLPGANKTACPQAVPWTRTLDTDLDIENHDQLAQYLRGLRNVEIAEPVAFKTLAGGVSNRTVLVRFADGQAWVLKQALAKLRTKADWFSDPARVHREALGIRWLNKLAPPGTIPGFVFEDFENHILGMHAVPEPHENWKEMLLAGRLTLDHIQQFAGLLGSIHRHAYESQETLCKIFEDRTFFESLRIEPYYGFTATQVPEARQFLTDLVQETRSRRLTLVHADFSPKNILVHVRRLILLDHEVIHWGDPAFDLGFALTHLLSKAHHLGSRGYATAAEEFYREYTKIAGPVFASTEMEAMVVRHTLGCLLARVAGRSPLEYLSTEERHRQQNTCLALIRAPIPTFDEFVRGFVLHTGLYEHH